MKQENISIVKLNYFDLTKDVQKQLCGWRVGLHSVTCPEKVQFYHFKKNIQKKIHSFKGLSIFSMNEVNKIITPPQILNLIK